MGLEGGAEGSGNAFACFLYGEWRNEESLHKPLIEGVIAKERYNKQECNSLTINKKMVVVKRQNAKCSPIPVFRKLYDGFISANLNSDEVIFFCGDGKEFQYLKM